MTTTTIDVVKREIRSYWNRRAEEYDMAPGHGGKEELWSELMMKVFEEKSRILDVGTGTGFLAIILANLGHEVVGIDLSENMLRVAREKAKKNCLKVEFLRGDAEDLPFNDKDFDAVTCRHLLWTLPNPSKAISEWKRVARNKVVAIDGNWYDKKISSRILSFVGKLGIAVKERKNPWSLHYKKEIEKALPYRNGLSAKEAGRLFEDAGLKTRVEDLSWLRKKLYEGNLFHRLAWWSHEYYMVVGEIV